MPAGSYMRTPEIRFKNRMGVLGREKTDAERAKLSIASRRPRKHGGYGTLTYHSWINMRQRCTNPKHPKFGQYGGRGITICERWVSFANFLADMGEKPAGLTLDRKNNNGNYEPTNCRWATPTEQARNRRPRKRHYR